MRQELIIEIAVVVNCLSFTGRILMTESDYIIYCTLIDCRNAEHLLEKTYRIKWRRLYDKFICGE